MRLLQGCAAAAAMLLTLAACGAGSPGSSAGPAQNTMSNADVLALGKQLAQCYRDNGIPEFPDPFVDDNGLLQLPDDMEEQIEGRYPEQTLERAQQACQSLFDQLPQSAVGAESNDDQQVPGPEDLDALRQFAACLRENGIPEFPDPKADGSFPVIGTPLEDERKSERLGRAVEACLEHWSGRITYS